MSAKSPMVRRALITVGCVLAFAIMASIFSPGRTRAGGPGDQSWSAMSPRSIDNPVRSHSDDTGEIHTSSDREFPSTDPHEGLQSLGIIEDRGYTVHIYATDGGPRFTVYERATGLECGALLSPSQVHQAFPDLQLPTMEFNVDSPLMMADSVDNLWW